MTEKKLREEYSLQYERRNRHIKQLIEESILNVLAEQQQLPQDTTPAVITPTSQNELPVATTPANQINQAEVPKQYTVDDMIEELNSIRGGKSFTDPEVYGRLVTFFKNLSDEQRTELNVLLVEISELVTSIEDNTQNQTGNSEERKAAAPPQTSNVQPPAETGQKGAPMPGAQKGAGAAGVGAT